MHFTRTGIGYGIMIRIWKKIACMTMIATMLMTLVACGGGNDNKDNSDKNNVAKEDANVENVTTQEVTTEEATTEVETIVITVLTDKEHLVDTKFAEYKATFESSNENVEVQFEAVKDYDKEVEKRLRSGNYGDVLLIPETVTNDQLIQYFEPLGTVEELSEDYDEKYLQAKVVDGVVYGLPRFVNVHGVAYNEVVFAKAGVVELPVTPGEFLSDLKKIQNTREGIIPYYTGYENGEWLWQWQNNVWGAVAADGEYRNNKMIAEQEPFAAETPNYIVHELLYDIVKNGLCEIYVEGENYRPVYRQLNQGKIGCMMLSSDYLHELQIADVNPDDISFMPFPYNIEGKQYATAEVDYCYAINKNSANKETARAWIDYMLKKSGFAKSEGAISIKKDAALPDVLSNFKDVELVLNLAATDANAGKYEELNDLSGIYLDSDVEKNRLILSALESSEETFEDIMNDWNLRWKAALQGIRYATVIETESDAENSDDAAKQSAPVVEITPEYQEFLESIRSSEQE